MSIIRWGVIFGSFALFISVALGIIAGVNPVYIFLRGLIFMVTFFGLGVGIRFFINTFFPELLYIGDEPIRQETHESTGTLIDITLGNTGEYAVPELYKDSGGTQELGNIEDLIAGVNRPRPESTSSKGIDRKTEEVYNNIEGAEASVTGLHGTEETEDFRFQDTSVFESVTPAKPVFTPSFGDEDDGLGGLPDLESMARAFSPGFSSESSFASVSTPAPAPMSIQPVEEIELQSYTKGNKPQTLKGDFNPQELAEGIRTVLSKDK